MATCDTHGLGAGCSVPRVATVLTPFAGMRDANLTAIATTARFYSEVRNSLDLAIALIAAAIALSQAWLLYAQARQARVTLCTSVADLWQKNIDSWRVMIAVAMGGTNNFYAPMLAPSEEEKVTELKKRLDGPIQPGFSQEQLWLSDHCRRALGTIALVAELVLSGRVSPADAYAILGLDLARRSRPLRDVLFMKSEIWLNIDTMGTQRGARARILALVDLMWVEAARRDDLPPWTLERAAEIKRSGSGRKARENAD